MKFNIMEWMKNSLVQDKKVWLSEIFVTCLDESWTPHFQLGLAKVFKYKIFTMMELTNIFRNVFCTHKKQLLQVSFGYEQN